jgi:hypothetical protein
MLTVNNVGVTGGCTWTITTSTSPVGFGGGSIVASCGSVVNVAAPSVPCYHFVNWTAGGNVVTTSPRFSFTPTMDVNLVANYLQNIYSVTASSSPTNGGVTGGGGTYSCGSVVTVTAVPASGFNFAKWMEGKVEVSASPNYAFTASANRALVANFVPMAAPPVITVEPQNLTVVGGQTATFSVSAYGTMPLVYQWQKNGTKLMNGGNVAGAKTPQLMLNTTTTNDAGTYAVVITNAYGRVTSSNAVLTVVLPPAITKQPQSLTVTNGDSAVFSVVAIANAPYFYYQWRKNGTSLVNGGNVSGATTGMLTLSAVSMNDAANYTVVLRNAYGSVTSSVASLTVVLPNNWVLTSATSAYWASVASSSNGTELAAAIGYTASGKMYTSTNSGVTWTAQNSGSHVWSSVASSSDGTKLVAVDGKIYTSTNSGVTWTARASSQYWQSVASSSDGTKLVAVIATGIIYTSTNSGVTWTAQNSGSLGWYSVASSSDGTKLVAAVYNGGQLYTSTNSGVTWIAQNSGSQNWVSVASSSDGTKLVAVVNDGQIYTSTNAGVTWMARASSQYWECAASSSDGTKLVAATQLGDIYTSTDSGVTWSAQSIGTQDWQSVASSSDGTKLVAAAYGGGIYTFSMLPPSIVIQPTPSLTVINGQQATLGVVASGTASLSYQWQENGSNLLNGGNIQGATSNMLSLATHTTNDTGNFTVIVSNGYGSVTSSVAILNVVPTPAAPAITVQPASLNVTNGQPAGFSVTANGTTPLSYQWQDDGINLTDGGNISGSISNSLTLNATSGNDAGNYTVIITNTYGSVTSRVAVLTVAVPITVYMNFDSVDAGAGIDATAYLASFGITLSNVSQPGSVYIVADTNYYGTGAVTASSPHNFLLQSVSALSCSYTLNFSVPLQSVTFTRIAISAGFETAAWTVTAYAGTNAVGSVGVCCNGSDTGQPAQTYTISGQGITSLTVRGDGMGVATAASAPLDDFYMTLWPAPPTLQGLTLMNGKPTFTLNGIVGQIYEVQYTTNLDSPNWTSLYVTNAPSASLLLSDPNATNPMRFYRVLLEP